MLNTCSMVRLKVVVFPALYILLECCGQIWLIVNKSRPPYTDRNNLIRMLWTNQADCKQI